MAAIAVEVTQKERHGVLFYSCDEMEKAGFAHGFSTRVGGVSPAPWDSLNLGAGRGDEPEQGESPPVLPCHRGIPDTLVKNHQITRTLSCVKWGGAIRFLSRARAARWSDPRQKGPGLSLCIFTADCIPVLLCDPVERVPYMQDGGVPALGIAAPGGGADEEGLRLLPAGGILRPLDRESPPAVLRPMPMCPMGCGMGWGSGRNLSTPFPKTPRIHVDLKGAPAAG